MPRWPWNIILLILVGVKRSLQLTIIEQTLHTRHRPPPGVRHVEVPERITAAIGALRASEFDGRVSWRQALESSHNPDAALEALKLVHSTDHLGAVQSMSKTGGGFDSDTYCAPGSWEAMVDGTRAWLEATSLARAGQGPAFALARPAGHHVARRGP